MIQNKKGVWVSWNENLSYNYESLYTIETEVELQDAVSNADKIRFFGTKQSSADIAAGVETLIDITSYNKILSFNENEYTVTVQSGLILGDFKWDVEE